ncbi:hypothetical protein, partial [Nonomuraea aridisoli]|uniref:hypothetical protein n=1 Tax=Nonomuraea aridisoli TaxID=2070368 RepID=UPI001C64E96E
EPVGAAAGKRRWWPWAAVVVALGVAAAVGVPGLAGERWPYEAVFGEGWEVGASEGGDARAAGAGYELTVNRGWRLWKSAPAREPEGGVVVSAEATLRGGAGSYGVWCHGSAASGDRYEFGVSDAGQVTIVKRRTGTEGAVLYGPAGGRKAATERIVAQCGQGGGGGVTLRLWLDERLVAEVADTEGPHRAGEVGVFAAAAADRYVRVRFGSFTVRPADAP